jgi:hypothetical protein
VIGSTPRFSSRRGQYIAARDTWRPSPFDRAAAFDEAGNPMTGGVVSAGDPPRCVQDRKRNATSSECGSTSIEICVL